MEAMTPISLILLFVVGLLILAVLTGCGTLHRTIAERNYPPTGRYLNITTAQGEHRMHIVEGGQPDGPPVVLIHGLFANTYDYTLTDFWQTAGKRYRLIAIDRPGKGYSKRPNRLRMTISNEAEVIQEALLQLGVEQAVIVGHSSGAAVTLAHATAFGESAQARGYITLAPSVRVDEGDLNLAGLMVVGAIRTLDLPIWGEIMTETVVPTVAWVAMPSVLERVFSPQAVPEVFADMNGQLSIRPTNFRNDMRDVLTLPQGMREIMPQLETLSSRVVILAGDQDQLANYENHAVWLDQLLPDSDLVKLHNVGHMVHVAAPELVIAAIDGLHDLDPLPFEDESEFQSEPQTHAESNSLVGAVP